MQKKTILSLIVMVIFASNLFSQVEIGGYVETDNRCRLQGDKHYTWNENRLGLKFEGNSSDKLHFYSELRLRGFGFPKSAASWDLQRREKDEVYPWALEFREAYVDIYGFLMENLDVRIGRQRITWGTADRLNPTDNLNPDDLEDLFNFGERLGSSSLKATYYLGNAMLTGVFVPVFTPAILPPPDWAAAFSAPMSLPPGMIIRDISDSLILPEEKLSESSMTGFKVATTLLNYDVSLSYFNGRDDLPLFNSVTITPVDTLGTVDVSSTLTFPRMQIVGADMAGAIGKVGIWAEGALTIPERVAMSTTLPTPMGMTTQTSTALDDEPYFKYVVGGDYTFKNGLYVNAQYLHGFIHERGRDELKDYIVFRFEKKFLNDGLKIVPFGGAISIEDWDDVKNSYGFVGAPEIDYCPSDNIELTLGAFLIEGKGESLFSRVKENDEVYVKVKVSF
ncbi:hypothetical protein ISS37_08685 [candidate division KSB1 bacterium]|nr:hypothetical protein [candidate division KSB1 bacterium]